MRRSTRLLAILIALTMGVGSTAIAKEPARSEGERDSAYSQTAQTIAATIRAHHYDPDELEAEPYLEIERKILTLGQTAETEEEFLTGFREIWRSGPFSHVNLNRAQGSVEDMVSHLDSLEAGPDAVQLEWQDDTAILSVNTMMGSDTIVAITAAYETIAQRGASKLIIDLRANEGGAFAIRPLIGHVLAEPFDAGVFVAQKWNAEHSSPPTREAVTAVAAWEGWSVRAFWEDAQTKPFIRVRLVPLGPSFDGPVFVLTSKRTASAAELAADALQASGRARVIGEQTAGEMLSQRPYDIGGKYHLFLPIADYFSLTSGRIEGNGVTPDIESPADAAMGIALKQ